MHKHFLFIWLRYLYITFNSTLAIPEAREHNKRTKEKRKSIKRFCIYTLFKKLYDCYLIPTLLSFIKKQGCVFINGITIQSVMLYFMVRYYDRERGVGNRLNVMGLRCLL